MENNDAHQSSNPYTASAVGRDCGHYEYHFARRLAIALFVLPVILIAPYCIWIYHDGGWLVSTDVEPENRKFLLVFFSIINFVALQIVAAAAGMLLLNVSSNRRRVSSCLVAIVVVVAIPCLVYLAYMLLFICCIYKE